MTSDFYTKHAALLDQAVQALRSRAFYTPYPEVPSQKIYGEGANELGKTAFEQYLGKPFPIDGAEDASYVGGEVSPYGFALGITYPKVDIERLLGSVNTAAKSWKKASPEVWAGVCLEILTRLNQRSFEMAYAVMHTSGQAFAMAFQAGGPHAQDRGLEAVAAAWQAISATPKHAYWEKPQGKHAPLQMQKHYQIVPRGIGLVIGCSTFPTWNSYSGLFANLATGNAVIVKPHPNAILPLAITVSIARAVLQEAGFDPNVVTLAVHDANDPLAQTLALRPEIQLIDFTGSASNGRWLEEHAKHAHVYTEKSGVNQIVIDSTDDIQGLARNIAFSLTLYSGQMCTAPQTIYIPQDGIQTEQGPMRFEEVVAHIAEAVKQLTSVSEKAVDLLGAITSDAVLARIAHARTLGHIVLDSAAITHPLFDKATIRTPLLVKVPVAQRADYLQEYFGPISFFVATNNTAESLAIAQASIANHGAITLSLYSTDENIIDDGIDVAQAGGVALSINLTGGVYVNQSAAFSDFHGTGANPAANCALTDLAFVANRFCVVQHRRHVRSA
jgi:phenylacetic acid degradation protein paaN